MTIDEYASSIGLSTCIAFDSSILKPEEHIRNYCRQNVCGNYGQSYMCPPYIGTLEKITEKLKGYNRGYLFQYTVPLDVRKDTRALVDSKLDFHHKILDMEKFLAEDGGGNTWGLIGGSCGLCHRCRVLRAKPCRHPDEARPSLEAIGVDVESLLKNFGISLDFLEDRVTWTGCVLLPE